MRKIKFFGFLALACVLMSGVAVAGEVRTSAKIGVLAPIGMNAEDVLKWSENVAEAEGKKVPFTKRQSELLSGRVDVWRIE